MALGPCCLTVKFARFQDAGEHTRTLQGAPPRQALGRGGGHPQAGEAELAAEDQSARHSARAGERVVEADLLRPTETLEQAHMDRRTLAPTRFYTVDEAAGSLQEIVTVVWIDDGERATPQATESFMKDMPEDLKTGSVRFEGQGAGPHHTESVGSVAALGGSRLSLSGSATGDRRQAAQHDLRPPCGQRESGDSRHDVQSEGGRAPPGGSDFERAPLALAALGDAVMPLSVVTWNTSSPWGGCTLGVRFGKHNETW